MSELRQILGLAHRATSAGEAICIATVVAVEGSSYRRPGARMLLTSAGERAGTISGGCLEAEVARKAWWLTERGPSLQRYSSFFDDDSDIPWGLGCGGAVLILLERGDSALQSIAALGRSVEQRTPSVILARLAGSQPGSQPGTALILDETGHQLWSRDATQPQRALALAALSAQASLHQDDSFAEFIAPPPALFLFGAGDDAQPLVRLASDLGWHVTVADARSQLLRPERFPHASALAPLASVLAQPGPHDAAVVMTHSYQQDRQILRDLLPHPLRYLGILGPRRRTQHLLNSLAPEIGLSPAECLARLHAPVGLDLGAHAPAAIALSIAAEIQAVFAGVASPQTAPPVPA